jgi:glycine betaine/proline transport system permease protein
MSFFDKFPAMERADLRDLKKGIDSSFKEFSRSWGEGIEAFFDPLFYFLVNFEKLLLATPWPIIIAIVAALSYLGSRSWKLSAGAAISFLVIVIWECGIIRCQPLL